tara:strand:+ start:4946 stop:5284 length:339 start_codon:yes stop_codon:yes gene_type:complete
MIFLLVGCAADTHSSLTEEMLDNLNDLVSVLQSVQDSSSAQSAIAKIEQINILGKDIQKRMDTLGQPSEDMLKELESKYSSMIEESTVKLREVLGGLIETEFGLDIMKALNK